MKSLKQILLAGIATAIVSHVAYGAALVTINVDTGSKSLQNSAGIPLSGGNPNVNGDGIPVQIGYYQGATTGSPFGTGDNATFISLIGAGSQHGVSLSIGDTVDDGAGNGEIFASGLNIFTGVNDTRLPVVGTPLVLRILNSAANEALVLSNALWTWRAPADAPAQPTININLSDAGLIGRTGESAQNPANVSGNNLRTAVVPEPSSAILFIAGLAAMASRRRDRKP